MSTLRRIDVISRRRIRQAVIAWHALTVRFAQGAISVVSRLPTDRAQQDNALYLVAVPCLLAVVLRIAEGGL